MSSKQHIAVTMGDPSGIGPEIAVKVLSKTKLPIKVYGNKNILKAMAEKLELEISNRKIINTINLSKKEIEQINYSQPCALSGKIAYSAIKQVVEDCSSKKASAVVTAPISKISLQLAGHVWPGHTELLAHLASPRKKLDVRMLLLSKKLLIVLNSTHLSLKQAILELNSTKVLKTISIANDWALRNNVKNPVIWLSALNPHAGESGLLGYEEEKILSPVIKLAKEKNIHITGPWPADTLFMKVRNLSDTFPPRNMIVALYHDQALIPFKIDGLNDGINLTAGLPFLRTSVDHGTAYDIAGKGIASEIPLKNAIILTRQLILNGLKNEK